MDTKKRWHPAVGLFAVGAVALFLGIQGASAERARSSANERAAKGQTPKPGAVAEPQPVQQGDARSSFASTRPKASASKPSGTPLLIPRDGSVRVSEPTWKPVGPEDLPGWPERQAEMRAARGLLNQNASEATGAALPVGQGSCCLPDCGCFNNVSILTCNANLGTFFKAPAGELVSTYCERIPCDCDGNGTCDDVDIAGDPTLDCDFNGLLDRCETYPCSACCDAAGNCLGTSRWLTALPSRNAGRTSSVLGMRTRAAGSPTPTACLCRSATLPLASGITGPGSTTAVRAVRTVTPAVSARPVDTTSIQSTTLGCQARIPTPA